MDRRAFLRAALLTGAAFAPRIAGAAARPESVLEEREVTVEGDRRLARRALLLLPRVRPANVKLPLLVLLHGLGETGDEKLGLRAWADRYGLINCYERLSRPPVVRTLDYGDFLSDDHAQLLNRALERQPFRAMALLCPVTPNVYRLPPTGKTIDRYADWLESRLLPAVRAAAPVAPDSECTAIDGCSLGGYLSLEVFLRKPHLFGSVGAVQAAIGVSSARSYAERLAKAARSSKSRTPAVRLGTSTADPYRKANERLSKELSALGSDHTLEIHPGPHSQPWLREVGTLSMLFWHDREQAKRGCERRSWSRP